ncbi:MAG: hypothetical protein JW966_06210 [Anaerolineae bacterium]|nr:hypothetical protein [Anaerolineae bacterium]
MRSNALVRLILNNIGWTFSSIFLAIVVWVAATMAQNPLEEQTIERIPITIVLPDGYTLSHQPSTTTGNVEIRAPQDELGRITTEDLEIIADLSSVDEPGDIRVELDANVIPPRRGQIVSVRPGALTLAVDIETEKRVPIRVTVAKEPPLGYTYPQDLACSQTEVTVRGSVERVNAVVATEVRLVLSDDLNPVLKETQSLIPVNENGRVVTGLLVLDPETVDCQVDIQPREDVFQMRVLPNVIEDPPPGYLFAGYSNVQPETVGVTGIQSVIESLNYIVRTKPIDLSTHTETFTVEVPVDLPLGVSLVPENQLITITVTINSLISSRQIENVPVEATGLDTTQFRATGLANTATVIALGPEAELPTHEDLRVVVDLTGLPPGNHQVPLTPEIIGQTEIDDNMTLSVLPERVSVTIEALNPTPTPSPTLGTPLVPTLTPTATAGATLPVQ